MQELLEFTLVHQAQLAGDGELFGYDDDECGGGGGGLLMSPAEEEEEDAAVPSSGMPPGVPQEGMSAAGRVAVAASAD